MLCLSLHLFGPFFSPKKVIRRIKNQISNNISAAFTSSTKNDNIFHIFQTFPIKILTKSKKKPAFKLYHKSFVLNHIVVPFSHDMMTFQGCFTPNWSHVDLSRRSGQLMGQHLTTHPFDFYALKFCCLCVSHSFIL